MPAVTRLSVHHSDAPLVGSADRQLEVSLSPTGAAIVRWATKPSSIGGYGRGHGQPRSLLSSLPQPSRPMKSLPGAVLNAVLGLRRKAAVVLRSLFLPVGYPDSVSPDYLVFQTWDTVQAMCSYLRGILATQVRGWCFHVCLYVCVCVLSLAVRSGRRAARHTGKTRSQIPAFACGMGLSAWSLASLSPTFSLSSLQPP
jgi:hypothetical protein